MLLRMSRAMVTLLLLLACLPATSVRARTLQAHVDRVTTAVATLDDVHVRLEWPGDVAQGDLVLTARALDAPGMGYHFRDLSWHCPLRHAAAGRWQCAGDLRSGRGQAAGFAIDLSDAATHAMLSLGARRLSVDRDSATPDETLVTLAKVPLAWSQALLSQAWAAGRIKGGALDGRLRVQTPKAGPLRVTGNLGVSEAALETRDATIAGDHLGGRFQVDYRKTRLASVQVDGQLRGGEFLVGNAYVALPATPVDLHVQANQTGDGGWRLPVLSWRDGNALRAAGSAAFAADTSLQALDLQLQGGDISAWSSRYLSGWLGIAGLADLQLSGSADGHVRVSGGRLQDGVVTLHDVGIVDPKGRFAFHGIAGTPRFSATAPVSGDLAWQSGRLYGIDFGAARLPIDSSNGVMRLQGPVSLAVLGGNIRFDGMTVRPAVGDAGADVQFGLTLDQLDIGALAKTLGWPAFQGKLGGRIPNAHYANQTLAFDGGLAMSLFGGTVKATALSLERPFGVAPSLTADLALDDIDLQSLTGVFDFGSITGRLAGRIDALRLVDWTATAFDAELHTTQVRGVPRRISQRAVQNISSVGDASFASSLQSQLLGIFNDFGYSRIGISCVLANEVCAMGGLGPASGPVHASLVNIGRSGQAADGFTIVEGAGIPHLTVVGYHRSVDWPTLLERLIAVSKGQVKPVVQ